MTFRRLRANVWERNGIKLDTKLDPEENWTVFDKTVHSSVVTTLGYPSRKHQDWFDENDDEIQRLVEEKHRLHKSTRLWYYQPLVCM